MEVGGWRKKAYWYNRVELHQGVEIEGEKFISGVEGRGQEFTSSSPNVLTKSTFFIYVKGDGEVSEGSRERA